MAKKELKKIRGVYEHPKSSDVWWILYYVSGKRYRERIGPRALAIEVLNQRKTDIKQEQFFPDLIAKKKKRAVTLEEAFKGYIERVKSEKITWREDVRYAGHFLKSFGKDTPVGGLTPLAIESWRRKRMDEGLCPSSVNRALAVLKHCYYLWIRDGIASENPVAKVKFLKTNDERIRYLQDLEEKALAGKMEASKFLLVELDILTGLRRSELFGLRWEYVCFLNKSVCIPRSKSGDKRHVPLSDRALEILQHLRKQTDGPWVFPSATGETHLDADNWVKRYYVPAVKAAGLVDLRFHDLRHTFASRLAMADVSIQTIQSLMGHKTIQMTLRYAHLSPGHLLKAVNKVMTRTRTGVPESAVQTLAGGPTATKTAIAVKTTLNSHPSRNEETPSLRGSNWSRESDLNRRPTHYEGDEIPFSEDP